MSHQLLFLLLLLLSLYLCQSASLTDTITPTQPLKDGHVLISGGNSNFALGFFSPGNSTRHRYVGIWYNKVSVQTVVWVANRDQPINGSDGFLSIAKDGNLVLFSRNSTVWSTNISHVPNHTGNKAQLLDSGNLILVTEGRGSQNRAWQSFDYPTHVLMPGMKLGLKRRTGLNRVVNSWRSSNDPGHGQYTFRAVPDGASAAMIVYKDGSVPIWSSGPWVGLRFSGIPVETRNYILDYNFVNNSDEVYYVYTTHSTSIFSIFILDGESGTLQRRTWHERSRQWIQFWVAPQDDCDHYSNCGAFGKCSWGLFECSCFPGYKPKNQREWYLRDASDGCTKATNVSMCRNGEGFEKLESVRLPNTVNAKSNLSMTLEECRKECLNNCSCLAYTSAIIGGYSSTGLRGCMTYHGSLIDTRVYDSGMGQDLYVRVDAVELAKSLSRSKDRYQKRLVIICVCVITTFTAVASVTLWFCIKKRREWREQKERSLWLGEAEQCESNSDTPIVFHLSTIIAATENFNPTNKLGEGGFGPVYKGILSTGQEIAIKRLSTNSGQGINEFKNEVRLVAKLQHRNLVRTLGCCIRGEEKMLVYEFLPNKSLDKYIFDEKKSSLLDWSKRYDIIVGVARGVLYLHQDSRLKIIHRDLKASNILLDTTMAPKISDFGLAKIFGSDQVEANTSRVVGTYGYMSPEYAMEGHFSIKSDVFSFGVILIEIISGKKSSGYYNDHLSTNLIGYVWKQWHEGNGMHIVDKSILLTGQDFEDEILRCIQIALLCVQGNPNERPTMSDVVLMLSNNSELPYPKTAFIIEGNHHRFGNPMTSSSGTQSGNDLTVTIVEAR